MSTFENKISFFFLSMSTFKKLNKKIKLFVSTFLDWYKGKLS